MTPEDAFLLDILSNPDDPTPRLVYADWLEDHSDARSASIRRGCDVLRAPAGSAERRRLREVFRLELPAECRDLPEIEGLVLTWRGLVAVFRYRLAEAITWCSGRPLPLRSPALFPGDAETPGEAVTNWGELVQKTSLLRSRELQRLDKTPHCLAEDLAGGRLLVYLPQLAQVEAGGDRRTEYLDGRLQPAWDAWLAYGREPAYAEEFNLTDEYVLAWVPEHLVGDVSARLDAESSGGLRWAEHFDRPLIRQLREAGLVGQQSQDGEPI